MPAKEQKPVIVQDIKAKLAKARSAVLTDYRGLNVAESTTLRRRLKAEGVDFQVIKNTLLNIAAGELGLEDMGSMLEGPTAVALSYDDPAIAAKLIATFAKEAKKMEIKGGLLEGKIVGADEMKRVADLPSREVLLGQVLAGAMAPLYGIATVASAPLRNLAYALNSLKELRESQA
ncbi:MAG: 50S ribosomal protein L10 [Bacillota bacterium]